MKRLWRAYLQHYTRDPEYTGGITFGVAVALAVSLSWATGWHWPG